jgi:hypothetical protein
VELKLLDDSLANVTVDVEVHHIDLRRIDSLTEFCEGSTESESLGQTVLTSLLTIDVTGNQTLLAEFL